MELAQDALQRLKEQAGLIKTIATHKKAIRLAGIALDFANKGLQMHSAAMSDPTVSFDGANECVKQAADHLQQAAVIHANTLSPEDMSPTEIDLHLLGKAQGLHQEYADRVTEGKNDYGR